MVSTRTQRRLGGLEPLLGASPSPDRMRRDEEGEGEEDEDELEEEAGPHTSFFYSLTFTSMFQVKQTLRCVKH